MDGFINLLKPPGMTSHDAVGYVRRQLGEKKIGHAGTLDPGAAGVLPIAVGKATRLIEYLDGVEKAYRAELLFGYATDSGDDSGQVHSILQSKFTYTTAHQKRHGGRYSQPTAQISTKTADICTLGTLHIKNNMALSHMH